MFQNPHVDFHAFAPLIVLSVGIVVVLLADLIWPERSRFTSSRIASIVVLAALIPVITLAADGTTRRLFGGAFVIDPYALAFDGFFLIVTYIVLLISTDYISDGDYYQGEFYFLMLTSLLGLIAMASARDLISIFVALETITIPTFILAGWRKHDEKSNEAAIKYFLIGVLSTAIMLYGMSIVYGDTGTTLLSGIFRSPRQAGHHVPLLAVAIFMTIAGFAFKVERGAVPLLDARHLRGRADTRHHLLVGGVEGRRVRGAAHHHPVRLLPVAGLVGARVVGARRRVDALRQPRRAQADQHRAHARVLVDRAGRLHPRAARGVGRRPGRVVVVPGGAHLHPDLRRDEPRRVRGRDRGGAAHALGRDRDVRGTRAHVARARGHHDDLHVLAGRDPAVRRVVRQVRDVPLDPGRTHRAGGRSSV